VSDTARTGITVRPVRFAPIAFFVLLAIKLYISVTAPPIGDEAYYWIWGQKLGWSYFDHPPLHAWLLHLASIFGWNLFGLRILTWLTFAGTLWIFWDWAKRLRPEDPGACNVYRNLEFPKEVYERIEAFLSNGVANLTAPPMRRDETVALEDVEVFGDSLSRDGQRGCERARCGLTVLEQEVEQAYPHRLADCGP